MPGTGRIQGALQALDAPSSIGEAEPNDSASQAHILGELQPGQALSVLGSLTDAVGEVDAFLIEAPQLSLFTVNLVATDPAAPVDFDFGVFDPVSLQPVELFESTTANSEVGSFVGSGSFFLVLFSISGDATYALDVQASAAPATLAEVEPNTAAGEAQYLGSLALGDSVSVGGSLGVGGDTGDRYLLALPQAGVLSFTATASMGEDFEVRISDATDDFEVPMEVDFFDNSGNVETGSINALAMTLIEVEVLPFMTSSGSYDISISYSPTVVAEPNQSSVDGLGAAIQSRVSVASLSQSRRGNPTSLRVSGRNGALARFSEASGFPLLAGEVIVAWETASAESSVADRLASYGGISRARVAGGPERVHFELPTGLNQSERERYTVALMASLAGDPAVRYAELNRLWQPLTAPVIEEPNDTFYNLQWHYPLIQLPAAWDLTTGNNAVIIAVLDTGSAAAADLLPRTIAGYDMISDPSVAGDGNGRDNNPTDVGDSSTPFQNSSFHGAHVAGTIGANTDDNFGVAGVTWAGRLMHVRVLGRGGGSTFDIADGIRYAARLANGSGELPAEQADIINMSLGGPGASQTMQDAVTAARNAGTLLVAAAGNDNSSALFTPAGLDGVISVSAVDARAEKAPYSNFHPTVDIAAPGGDVTRDVTGDGYPDGVLSNRPKDTVNPTQFNTFEFYQGTSMAAPHVAGVAALVKSMDMTLTVPEIEQILLSTSTDLGAAGRDNIYGEGLVNAFAAVQAAAGGGAGGGPSLNLSQKNFVFSSNSCAVAQVANLGDGTLNVTAITPSTNSGGNWLSASAITISSPVSSDTASVEVCANPGGLGVGTYTGQVLVASNGGSETITVSLSVSGGGGSVQNQDVFVLAVELESLETAAQDVVSVPSSSNYVLPNLEPGSYVVVAGTDVNNDGFICDEGEPLCGIFPTVENPILIEVLPDNTVQQIDFPVLGAFTGASTSTGSDFRGYRLLNVNQTGAGQ